MLNQVTSSNTVLLYILKKFCNHRQLMVTRKHLLILLLFGFRIYFLNNLRIIFNNIGKPVLSKDILPQVIRHDAIGIGRITCTIVVSLIKRQEPGILTFQFRAELHSGIIQGEVYHTPFKLEQQFLGIAVCLILIDRIIHVLLCQLVFQLTGNNRQTIDEDYKVQRKLCIILGVHQLSGNTEDILSKELFGLFILFGGSHIEHHEVGRINFDAITQNIYYAPLRNLALQPVQKLDAFLLIACNTQHCHLFRLSRFKESEQPGCINSIFLAIIRIRSLFIPVLLDKPIDNQGFQTAFFCICGHIHTSKSQI